MNWSDLGKKLADFAPLLGSALGPAGNAVGSLIASEFGTENNPDAIHKAILGDPEARVKLARIQADNKVELEKLVVENTRLELADKADARANHKDSIMPAALSVGLTCLAAIIIGLLFWVQIPDGSREVLYMLLGVVIKSWDNSMQYWYGTTRSSAEKTKLLKK